MNDQKVKQLYQCYHLPKHIQMHCLKVAQVAIFIGRKIKQSSSHQINLENLRYAALLHDLFRMCDIKSFNEQQLLNDLNATPKDISYWKKIRLQFRTTPHWEAAHQILEQHQEPEIAQIILTHDFLSINKPNFSRLKIEQKILYYADKRVCHDQITTLESRIKEGTIRYIGNRKIPKTSQSAIKLCYQLEEQICLLAQIKPTDINEYTCGQLSVIQ